MSTFTEANTPMCVNWHITETCNFGCKHCFAKWNKQREVWDDPDQAEHIIKGIANYVDTTVMIPKHFRLNIVGGEPMMNPDKLWNVVKIAKDCGAEVSMITNGSHLEVIRPIAHIISQVGISVDSFDHETNLKIGRACNGKTLSFEEIKDKIKYVQEINPKLKIKVNTVVNKYNFSEQLLYTVLALKPCKWKILRQMPFGENKGIPDFMFYSFIRNNYKEFDRHHDGCEITIEDNNAMTESYLMISPDGRLFQNGSTEYSYSRPLTEISFAEALQDIKFNEAKFDGRYDGSFTWQAVHAMEKFFGIVKPVDPFNSIFKDICL